MAPAGRATGRFGRSPGHRPRGRPRAALQLLLTEDIHSVPLRPLGRARIYARLTRELRLPVNEVASCLALDTAEVDTKLRLLTLDPDMIESIESGRVGKAQAERLIQVSDETLRWRLWRYTVRHGWSPDRMTAAVARRAARSAPSEFLPGG